MQDEELDYDNGPGSVAFERRLRQSEHEFNKNKPCVIYFQSKLSDKPLRSPKDIVVGQFYLASRGCRAYYYVGMRHKGEKHLMVISTNKDYKGDFGFVSSDKSVYKEMQFVECTQEEVMRAK